MKNQLKTDLKLETIDYSDLNHRQKETYNFQKVSAILADYGYATIKLNDDYNGADFIAQHIDGNTYLKVQLKGRLTFDKKYLEKDIYVCFPYQSDWYLYNHDLLLKVFLEKNDAKMSKTKSWEKGGGYSWGHLSKGNKKLLENFKIKELNRIAEKPDGNNVSYEKQ